MDEIRIFTDGGSRGNPGPAALGVYIEDKNGKKLAEIGKVLGINTNNFAEYSAVIEGLDWVLQNKEKLPAATKILFFLDSLLVCSQMRGVFKVKNPNIRPLFEKAKTRESEVPFPISYAHVPREQNKNADRMVNYALDNSF